MRLVIVTGMSGAGKTTALKVLEDFGFYCVDNLPIPLMEKFAELVNENSGDIKNAALGIDIRSGEELSHMAKVLDGWKKRGVPYEILFLDAADDVLVKRYKETRRSHPLAGLERIDRGIEREREKLRREIEQLFVENEAFGNLFVTILSFGFKYGIPQDADLVFDVRFLPNPYYEEHLRTRTGEEKEVQDFVKQGGTADIFMEKLCDMIEFLLPNYVLEGKNQLVIAIGCTGGKHRSVTIAKELQKRLSSHREIGLKLEHRDMGRDGGGAGK